MSATATAPLASPASRLAMWARQGIESFVAAQKILLDLTAQQNALAIGVIRERLKFPTVHPGDAIANVANQSVSGLTSAGKILLDLASGETTLVIDGLKEILRMPPAGEAVTDLLAARVQTIVEMQKKLLDATTEQTNAAVESYKAGDGLHAGQHTAELVRDGIQNFVDTEKKFLDMVSEHVNKALETSGHPSRKAAKSRTKAIAHLAREGVDKFVTAQKQLMNLAIDQLETRIAPEKAEEVEEEPRTSWKEVTQKSIQNFVTAQKSLMDLAVKPARHAPAEHHRAAPARRARRRR